jgi:hypothetical protein
VAGYKVKVMLAEPKTKRRNAGSPEMMYHMHQVSLAPAAAAAVHDANICPTVLA